MKISEAINNYLIASNIREETPGKKRKFYVSDTNKCLRMRYLKRKGVDTEMAPFVYWIFAQGNMIHDFGYKALEAQGLLLEAEEYVTIGEHFTGRFDGKVKTDSGPSIFDFKSAGKYKIQKVIAGEDDEEAIGQLLTYILFYKKEHPELSDTGYVIYVNKEPSDEAPQVIFEKEYHLTKWRADKILEEQDKLVSFWTKDKIPPCTCSGWAKGPKYNSYYPLCQASEKDILKVLKLLSRGHKIISTKEAVFSILDEKREEVIKV